MVHFGNKTGDWPNWELDFSEFRPKPKDIGGDELGFPHAFGNLEEAHTFVLDS
jgi:hypothetical protein